jgi:hypothetical protein
MNLFQPRPSASPEQNGRIQSWVRNRLSLDEDTVVTVSELRCSEPGCPPLETLIAVLDGPGKRRQVKFHKPAAEIALADIESAVWSS